MAIALLVVVLLFGMLIVFGVVGIAALGSKREVDTLGAAIASGQLAGLTPFGEHLLPWLSKDLVGTASSAMPFGGAVTGSLAATIPSCAGPATLLGLRAELSPRQGRGRIDVQAGGPRVALDLHQGLWHATVDGRPIGTIEPASGRVEDVSRSQVGWLQRSSAGSQLHLRGVPVASLDGGAALHAHPIAAPRPLLQLPGPLPPGDAWMWTLAVVGLELGTALTPTRGRGSSSGVP